MAIDVAGYTKELMDAAGISDEAQRRQLETIFSNDAVKGKLHSTLEAIEREKGRAAAAAKEAEAFKGQANTQYQESLRVANEANAKIAEATAAVQAYEKAYGPLDETTRRAAIQHQVDAIDKKTFDERLGKTEGLTVALIKTASTITAKHLKDFNEVPDFDAIEKIATEQGLTAQKAYEEWARPKWEAKHNAEIEARVQKAREEGMVEGASKKAAAVHAAATEQSPFMANLRKATGDMPTPQQAFVNGWNESAAAKQ